jgi:parallel beta-helix repeat protein
MRRVVLRALPLLAMGALVAPIASQPSPAAGLTGPTTAPVGLKDTAYAIPPGAKFASPTGNDAADGSQSTPWRTIQHAVDATPSGGTIVIRGGTYRESIALSNKTLTLQPYPHEQAWVKGSTVVTGWVAEGSAWRKDGWSTSLPALAVPSGYIDPSHPMAGYPDMTFLSGQPLTQVASRSAVAPGTFYVDKANKQLFLGTNPSGATVEGSVHRNDLVLYNAPNSRIVGLGFMHAASSADSASSAVIVNTSNGVTLENNTFAWNAASGVEVGQLSDNVVVRGNQMVDNGLVGATSWGTPHNLLFQNNYAAFNNQEHFSIYWAAGGVKLNGVAGTNVSDNVVEGNIGTGIWCDNSCSGVTVVRNLVRNNAFPGIMYEISDGAIIASNLVVNNASSGGGGIYVSESTNSKVYNNTIVSSSVSNARSIDVNSGSRKTTSGVVIKNNILSHSNSSSLWAVRVQDDTQAIGAASMVSAMDYNAYYRRSTSSPPIEVRWSKAGGFTDYMTLAPFQSGTQYELHGLAVDNQTTDPFFVSASSGDYHLKSTSAAKGRGAALPADVASAVGVAAGVAVDLGVLAWPPSDLLAPSAPTGLSAAAASSSQVNLSWTGASDNVGVAAYDVYRGGAKIASVSTPSYANTGLSAATAYSYYVVARDGAGNVSGASSMATATTPSASTTTSTTTPVTTSTSTSTTVALAAPTVTISSPANNAKVAKKVWISSKATGPAAIKSMKLLIDGKLKTSSTTSSLTYNWFTGSTAAGSHTIKVTAVDAAGHSGTRTITVRK